LPPGCVDIAYVGGTKTVVAEIAWIDPPPAADVLEVRLQDVANLTGGLRPEMGPHSDTQ